MSTLGIIKKLCDANGLSIAQLEKELNYSNGSLSKSRTIKADRLMEIAKKFRVSMEYLMTGEDNENGYYLDSEAAEIAQEMATRPELKVLFKASRNVSKESIEAVNNIIKQMEEKQRE